MSPFTVVGPIRTEWMVVVELFMDTEVLYRSREEGRARAMLSVVQSAYHRGVEAAASGWPDGNEERLMFSRVCLNGRKTCALCPPTSPIGVIMHHPRLSFGGRVLFRSSSRPDADMALRACRRSATLGALMFARRQRVLNAEN